MEQINGLQYRKGIKENLLEDERRLHINKRKKWQKKNGID